MHPRTPSRQDRTVALLPRKHPRLPPCRASDPATDGPTAGPGELSDTADVVLSFLVICPLVATFWRGSWVFLDVFLPTEPVRSGS